MNSNLFASQSSIVRSMFGTNLAQSGSSRNNPASLEQSATRGMTNHYHLLGMPGMKPSICARPAANERQLVQEIVNKVSGIALRESAQVCPNGQSSRSLPESRLTGSDLRQTFVDGAEYLAQVQAVSRNATQLTSKPELNQVASRSEVTIAETGTDHLRSITCSRKFV